jgi:hypothetical protein
MNVTLDESIAIYARVSRKWFGGKAHERTQERIDQLAKAGDWEGARVHQLVRERLSRTEPQPADAHRGSTVSDAPPAGG